MRNMNCSKEPEKKKNKTIKNRKFEIRRVKIIKIRTVKISCFIYESSINLTRRNSHLDFSEKRHHLDLVKIRNNNNKKQIT